MKLPIKGKILPFETPTSLNSSYFVIKSCNFTLSPCGHESASTFTSVRDFLLFWQRLLCMCVCVGVWSFSNTECSHFYRGERGGQSGNNATVLLRAQLLTLQQQLPKRAQQFIHRWWLEHIMIYWGQWRRVIGVYAVCAMVRIFPPFFLFWKD